MSQGAPIPGAPPDGAPAAEATVAPGQRPLPLTLLLGATLVLNTAGLAQGLARREELLRDIPRLTAALHTTWMVAAALAVLGAAGLWFFRRFGLYSIGLAWLLVVVVDLKVGATSHLIFATGLMWLVVIFVRPIRERLR